MEYAIISDGCCDLEKEVIEAENIHVIPFYITFDGHTYKKEIEEIGIRDVYEQMVGHPDVYPMTSLPSLQDFAGAFTQYAEQKIPVICICFTPSLSGSYNCACNAKNIVLEDYPDADIAVINSEAGTVTQGLMVTEAARMRRDGISYERCVSILEKMKKTNRIFFTVGNTDYLKHGGRIGRLAGIASSALALKPMIILAGGYIDAAGVGRSRKKTVAKTIVLMDQYFEKEEEKMEEYRYRVGFGYDIEEGKAYYDTISAHIREESAVSEIEFSQIGATIAVHTGPYAIGIGIIKKYEYIQ